MVSASDPDEIRDSRPRHPTTFLGFFVVTVIIVNAMALFVAWRDSGWGAIVIAVIVAPVLNGVLAVGSLCATPAVRRRSAGWFFLTLHILASLLIPALASGIDIFLIDQMPMHGG